jgi:hypothetical protein
LLGEVCCVTSALIVVPALTLLKNGAAKRANGAVVG